jgi:hypothetical protein
MTISTRVARLRYRPLLLLVAAIASSFTPHLLHGQVSGARPPMTRRASAKPKPASPASSRVNSPPASKPTPASSVSNVVTLPRGTIIEAAVAEELCEDQYNKVGEHEAITELTLVVSKSIIDQQQGLVLEAGDSLLAVANRRIVNEPEHGLQGGPLLFGAVLTPVAIKPIGGGLIDLSAQGTVTSNLLWMSRAQDLPDQVRKGFTQSTVKDVFSILGAYALGANLFFDVGGQTAMAGGPLGQGVGAVYSTMDRLKAAKKALLDNVLMCFEPEPQGAIVRFRALRDIAIRR